MSALSALMAKAEHAKWKRGPFPMSENAPAISQFISKVKISGR